MRAIDHLVLPVEDLATTRERYERLGFSVSKDGHHPFGTSNCCVFLADGTYLEPLAIRDGDLVSQHIDTNPFLEQDRRFRDTAVKGETEGLSTLSLASKNFEAEQEAFKAAGFGRDHPMSFSRAAKHEDGSEDVLSVRGAFCLSKTAPLLGFFTIDWLGDPDVVSRIKKAPAHSNGVIGIKRLIVETADIDEHLLYLKVATDADAEMSNDAAIVKFENAVLEIRQAAGQSLKVTKLEFQVADTSSLSELLSKSGINFLKNETTLEVAPTTGQGITFLFSE